MIKNLKGLRSNAPQTQKPLPPMSRQAFAKKPEVRQSSEEMDFDDWSDKSNVQPQGFDPSKVQKGFFGGGKPGQKQTQYENNYYDDQFEESDEMEALPFNAGLKRPGYGGYNGAAQGRLQQMQSDDVDFDDSNEFDDGVSNGQDSDDFGDVQLNVRKFKSNEKKVVENKQPVKQGTFDNFTDESGFNFEEEEQPKIPAQTQNVGRQMGYNAATDKKTMQARNADIGAVTTKVAGLNVPSNNKAPVGGNGGRRDPSSAEQFEDNFSDDFTQNVASVDNTQNNAPEKPMYNAHKSDVDTFKSDFDEFKESFDVDISNFDNGPVSKPKPQQQQPAKKPVEQAKPAQRVHEQPTVPVQQTQARVNNYNDIDAVILADRNVENKYLSGKLDENDAYTRKIKEFMEQKTLEHEKLKARYELLVKEKVRLDDANLAQQQAIDSQTIEMERLGAEADAKQLVIDELTEKLSVRTEELKAKTKLLQERENLFGNSLNEKKLQSNMINLSRDLELAKVRIADLQEAVTRYESRTIELEDELRGSPAAIRTKALMQSRIEKLLKLLADNGIAVEVAAVDAGDLNEDMVYQEMILNGYIKDNKKLIDENKFLKEKLFAHKVEESKSHFDTPAGRVKELEDSVKRLQEELVKKDEAHKRQAQRVDKADEILCERDRQVDAMNQKHESETQALHKQVKALQKEQKEAKARLSELKAQVEEKDAQLRKVKIEMKDTQAKAKVEKKPQLQRNIFSHSDQEFKQDLVSMLNNINADNQQVRSELRGLKDTWELKAPLQQDIRGSEIPARLTSNERTKMQDKAASKDIEQIQSQLQALRAANAALEDKVLQMEQQLGEKARELKKAEFLGKRYYDERQKLLEVVKNMPKTARDVDFAVLEQKLINLEKEQRLKALELQTALKTFNGPDLSESTDTIRKAQQEDWQQERGKLLLIIKEKNDKLGQFKSQMDLIIGQLKQQKQATAQAN